MEEKYYYFNGENLVFLGNYDCQDTADYAADLQEITGIVRSEKQWREIVANMKSDLEE